MDVSADATGAYLCSALDPDRPWPQTDAVVIRASDTGTFEWLRRIGRPESYSVAGGLTPVAGGVLVTGGMTEGLGGPELLLAKISPDGETCAGGREIPATTGISVIPVDPLLAGLQVTPVFEPFSPSSPSMSAELATCANPLAVPEMPRQ